MKLYEFSDNTSELLKYGDDTFYHFTDILKIGIHPSTEYNTPVGIYAFPKKIVKIIDGVIDVPFATHRKYVIVLEQNPAANIVYMPRYNINMWERDYEILRNMTPDELEIDFNEAKTCPNKYISYLWYYTFKLSKTPQKWNALLRKLGYDGFVDIDNYGLIHENEPTQAVFLSNRSVKIINILDNHRERKKIKGLTRDENLILQNLKKDFIYQAKLYNMDLSNVSQSFLYELYLYHTHIFKGFVSQEKIKISEQLKEKIVQDNPYFINLFFKHYAPVSDKIQKIAIEYGGNDCGADIAKIICKYITPSPEVVSFALKRDADSYYIYYEKVEFSKNDIMRILSKNSNFLVTLLKSGRKISNEDLQEYIRQCVISSYNIPEIFNYCLEHKIKISKENILDVLVNDYQEPILNFGVENGYFDKFIEHGYKFSIEDQIFLLKNSKICIQILRLYGKNVPKQLLDAAILDPSKAQIVFRYYSNNEETIPSDIVLKVVKRNPNLIKYVRDPSDELLEAVVSKNGGIEELIHWDMEIPDKVMMVAIKHDPKTVCSYMMAKIQNDETGSDHENHRYKFNITEKMIERLISNITLETFDNWKYVKNLVNVVEKENYFTIDIITKLKKELKNKLIDLGKDN